MALSSFRRLGLQSSHLRTAVQSAQRACYHGNKQKELTEGAEVVDLRSDVLTKPSAAMRRALAEGTAGDDVFSEDPTVLGQFGIVDS